MGLLSELFKRRSKADRVSKGGSSIYHYEDKESEGWRPPEAYGVYVEEINAHFQGLFPNRGEFVFHKLLLDLIHIDVSIMQPDEARPYYIMYTTGMSDMPMTLPEETQDKGDLRYKELYMFLPKEWNPGEAGQVNSGIAQEEYWPIGLIKYLARFLHKYNTWPGWGHTIPNGPDYELLAPDTGMGGMVLVQTGGDMGGMEAKDGRKVNFCMIIPTYREEIEYELEYGMEALDKRFSERNLPIVLDIHRFNLCADFKEQARLLRFP